MDYRERDPMHRTCILCMGAAKIKQEEEADTRIIIQNMEERNVGTKGTGPKLATDKNLTSLLAWPLGAFNRLIYRTIE